MKTSIAHIGYIAGLMERRGYKDERETAERGLEFHFNNSVQAKWVNGIIGGRIIKRAKGLVVYLPPARAIGWFMTCYPLVSQRTKDRIEHAIISWKKRQVKGIKNRPAPCHPDRPYCAKGKCQLCYNRARQGVLPMNFRKGRG